MARELTHIDCFAGPGGISLPAKKEKTMMRRFLMLYALLGLFALPLAAQDVETAADEDDDEFLQLLEADSAAVAEPIELHVTLLGIPLDASPQELLSVLSQHGLRPEAGADTLSRYRLTGTVSGLPVDVEIGCNRGMTKVNFVRMSTLKHQHDGQHSYTGQHQHADQHSYTDQHQHEDFERMSRWLHKEYGPADWTGSVRSHPFRRWFIDFDHDIVLIATGSGTVEVWFYENHDRRNVDYYSILKYCERHPSADVPFMTAQGQVTWKNLGDSTATVRKHHVAKRKHKRGVGKRRRAVRGKSSRAVRSPKARKSKASKGSKKLRRR